ncbi:MAG: hypothetical protein M3209_14070 [Acidobacteriota bacterium]|nr:hypothetical protein [Acidobacteriota bacterium]
MARRSSGRRAAAKSRPRKCEKTSPRMAKIASKVLRDKRFSKKAKSLAGSVLTQA